MAASREFSAKAVFIATDAYISELQARTGDDPWATRTSARWMRLRLLPRVRRQLPHPIDHVQARQVAALRIDASANRQTFGVRWRAPSFWGVSMALPVVPRLRWSGRRDSNLRPSPWRIKTVCAGDRRRQRTDLRSA